LNHLIKVLFPVNEPNLIYGYGGRNPKIVKAYYYEIGGKLPEPNFEKRKFQHEAKLVIPQVFEY